MDTIDEILSEIDAEQGRAVERLFAFLRIPSVSAAPAHFADCDRAADWLVGQLAELGFDAAKHPTEGRPMVLGHREAARGDAPHVLFYGHYDVQPADPLGLWRNPPFEPKLEAGPRGERIVARGASDDKGQLMTFLEACRAFKKFGGPPCAVTVLFEGEEETGSPSLPAFLAEHAEHAEGRSRPRLRHRHVGAVDAGDHHRSARHHHRRGHSARREPRSALGRLRRPGRQPDPCRSAAFSETCTTRTGAVAIPGFYDGVEELPDEIRQQWSELDFDAAAFLGDVGLTTPAGERDRTPLEQLWSRPTCEVNGIVGGYTGEGTKTVLPAEASAKVSFRLVGKQNPERVLRAFRSFVASRLPPDVKAEFIGHGGSPAISLPIQSEPLRRARQALETEWGKPAALIGCGGSIPIVGAFKRELDMDSLLVGFALEDDNVHSPNEKYELASFRKGARSWARILSALAA